MGSFNVACSISKISISSGTRVAFFPLVLSRYKEQITIREPYLCTPMDLLVPITLPVFGRYDDYGSIEDIEETPNTKYIEEYFNISIKEFIDSIVCSRSPTCYLSATYNIFTSNKIKEAIHPEIGYATFGHSYLINLGFERLHAFNGAYYDFKHKNLPYLVKLIGNYNYPPTYDITPKLLDFGYEIIDVDGNIVSRHTGYDCIQQLLLDFYELTGYYIHIDRKHQETVKLLHNASGMFVHGEIYEHMSHEYSTGFNSFDIKKSLEKSRLEYNKNDKLFSPAGISPDSLLYLSSYGTIWTLFREWGLFKEIYVKGVLNGDIDADIENYYNFYKNMYSTSNMFFPTTMGEQCGNHKLTKILLEKSLEIVDRKIKEMEY